MKPFLSARRVTRSYGAHVALEPTDLDVGAETLALVGPNGAGKSTLLSLLAGALQPSSGTVMHDAALGIGWVPQQPAFYERLTARENLELFARLGKDSDAPATTQELIRRFDLPDDRAAAAMSVGNRQRLNVALGLLGDPRVLLLDEPTASLDPGQRRRLWEIVGEVRAAGGAVVFSTQNLEELELYADRVAVLQRGRVSFAGPVAEYERLHAGEVFA